MRKICYMCRNWNGETMLCKVKYKITAESETCSDFVSIPCCGNCSHYAGGRCYYHGVPIDDDEQICRTDDWEAK